MSELLETHHDMPTPWAKSEAERLAEVAKFRAEVTAQGGQVVEERRVRNPVFDRKGERTTFKFRVRWAP